MNHPANAGSASSHPEGRRDASPHEEVVLQRDGSSVLSLKEAAAMLGVSYSTVYRMVQDGQIEAYRIRTQYRIPRKACEKFVRDETKKLGYLCKIRKR